MYRMKVTSGIVTPLSRVQYSSPSYKAGQDKLLIFSRVQNGYWRGQSFVLRYRKVFCN